MAIPISQAAKVGWYVLKNRMMGKKRYPLVLMLEPLYRCNLACKGCGKIQHPMEILRQHLSVEQCLQAARECPAPVVSIAGGEPLIHPDIEAITDGLLKMGRLIYLCTNGLPLKKKMDAFKPHKNLTFSLHLDGMRETHDRSVCKDGVFDEVIDYIKELKKRGFRVSTNTTIFDDHTVEEVREMLDLLTDLGVDNCMLSPGYAYEKAPDQAHFLRREKTRQYFRALFDKPSRKWPINHSRFYLEFLMGNRDYKCTPWGNPCRSVLGWQRPCYLFTTELEKPYAETFKELMDDTDWDLYGTGNHEKCANCMAHCGYEASAVSDTVRHPVNMIIGGRPGIPKPSKKLLARDRELAAAAAANGGEKPAKAEGASANAPACAGGPVQKSPF
ncbi:MAG: adenosyl-hopene transferase HpnH [Planctomycetota bacterium]